MPQSEGDLLRFDGRVAIVTGAGGREDGLQSLGRAYARLLGSRGAKVVVNDLGVGPGGRVGRDGAVAQPGRAEFVAQEIVEDGGEAIADTHSVADRDSAHAIVQTALDEWGRVDIVVNNAGAHWLSRFDEMTDDDVVTTINTHLMGNIWMCRAAWPHMKREQYGRIVNISSGSMFGYLYVPIYGAAKAGIYGLTRGLAVEGLEDGIRVNAVMPGAYTADVERAMVDSDYKQLLMRSTPEQVAPAVAYLAHETCSLTGKAIRSAAGKVGEIFSSNAVGYSDPDLTPEAVRDHLETVLDRTDAAPVDEADSPDRRLITPIAYTT